MSLNHVLFVQGIYLFFVQPEQAGEQLPRMLTEQGRRALNASICIREPHWLMDQRHIAKGGMLDNRDHFPASNMIAFYDVSDR